MSYTLNSLKGVIWGIIYGTTIGVIRRDTRSLDYSSHKPQVDQTRRCASLQEPSTQSQAETVSAVLRTRV